MKNFKAMCFLAILFLFPTFAFAQDADITVCKRANANGTASYMFPSTANYNRCLNGWEPVALQDALSGMTDSLESEVAALKLQVAALQNSIVRNFSAPPDYDRIYIEHNQSSAPNPPEKLWLGSEGEYSLIYPEPGAGVGPRNLWMTSIYDTAHGWTTHSYYKIDCVRASHEWFRPGTPQCQD